MHDIFEGVCHFQMTKIILHFLEINLFTLDDLNNRKSLFDYGFYQIDHRSVDIQMKHLQTGKLKMSGSQSLCFTTYFSLIIGDLVPRDEAWELYRTLLKILDVLMQNSLSMEEIENLDILVETNHNLYMNTFQAFLKPKHHFMVHYANLIRLIEPLRNIHVMKQEMYHRELKRYINQSYNRINLPKSVLIKESLKFAARLVEGRGYSHSPFNQESVMNTSSINTTVFAEIKKFFSNEELSKVSFIKEIYYKNMLFKVGTVLPIYNSEKEAQFCKVLQIVKVAENSFKLFTKMFEVTRFDAHLMCYIIKESENWFKMITFEDLRAFPQNCHKLATGELSVRPATKL